jgi:dihydroorotase-like cyclic amidohydrolase
VDKYAAWHPADLENFYLSPGVVDVNVRANEAWESGETRTKEAISGGVTMMLEEPSLYGMERGEGLLYCDVGSVGLVEAGVSPDPDATVFALKGYLYPPSAYVGGLASRLRSAMEHAAKLDLPLFLDPCYPSPRMLYLGSPLHNKPLQDRFQDLDSDETQFFASVYPDIIESSSASESLSDAEEPDILEDGPDRTVSNIDGYPITQLPAQATVKEEAMSARHDRFLPIRSFRLSNEGSCLQRQSSVPKLHTIYDDFNKRIKKHHGDFENVTALEMESYEYSEESPEVTAGRKRSQSMQLAQFELVITESESSGAGSRDVSPLKGNEDQPEANLYQERVKGTRPSLLSLGRTHKPSPVSQSKDRNYMIYLANSPCAWEIKGVDVIAKNLKVIPSQKTPCRVHITNLSSAEAVNQVRQIKEYSELVTCETCPHYLFFTADQIAPGDTRFKAFPAIRDKQNSELLWDSLLLKVIDVISSNHAAVAKELKFQDLGSFKKALSGINSLAFSFMAIWTQLKSRYADHLDRYVTRMAKWLSQAPAKLIGVGHIRGSIEKGKYADIVIWSPFKKGRVVQCSAVPSLSPYVDASLDGTIHRVYLRGKIAYNEGSFTPVGKRMVRQKLD